MLRELGPEFIDKLENITQKKVTLVPLKSKTDSDESLDESKEVTTRFGNRKVKNTDTKFSRVEVPLADFNGKPIAYLSIDVPRDLQHMARRAMFFTLLSVVLCGSLLAIVFIYYIDSSILTRLISLSLDSLKISKTQDFRRRFQTQGNDEISRLAGSMNRMLITLDSLQQQLEENHQKSENVLLNMLPAHVAERLKEGDSHLAEHFEQVTLVFADLVGFTPLSEELEPTTLVSLLNDIVSAFDIICESCGLEKIKTIGDAYMAVAGLDEKTREIQADQAVEFGRKISKQIEKISRIQGYNLRLRIGIATGPAVAGVIGKEKFHFDLWGDTVNLASRLESSGFPESLLISDRTYQLLSNKQNFVCIEKMFLKGKKPQRVWISKANQENHAAA